MTDESDSTKFGAAVYPTMNDGSDQIAVTTDADGAKSLSYPTMKSTPAAVRTSSGDDAVDRLVASNMYSSMSSTPQPTPPEPAPAPVAAEPEEPAPQSLEEFYDRVAARNAKWRAEAESDASVMSSLPMAQAAVDQFGSAELIRLLDESGLGSNKHVLQFAAKVGKALAAKGRR